jgi:hypothetical protein
MLAIVPPRFNLGRLIYLSSSVSMDFGTTAPLNITLLWLVIVGSVKAKHKASLGSMGSANVSVVREILLAVLGRGTMLLLSKS